jgi:hypothetical protein
MPLWEGQDSNLVFRSSKEDVPPYELPFKLRLDDFQMDLYPGTRRPAMFRSKVVVLDAAAGGERPAVIEMNRPLTHGGFSFFQSSYQMRDGREMSVLSVARDPGEPVVFLGYTLLVAGMIVVLVTRLVQQHRQPRRDVKRGDALALALVALLAGAAAGGAALVPDDQDLGAARPACAERRSSCPSTPRRATTSGRSPAGARGRIDPVAMAFGWALDPQGG